MPNQKYILNSVDNTLKLIDLLSENEEMGVAEISRTMDLGKATIFRILATLENREFVNKTHDAKYSLGTKFAHYGRIVLDRQNLIKIVRPYLEQLKKMHNETTHMSVLSDDYKIIVMEKIHADSSIQMGSRIGAKMPAYATAGKLLLAYLKQEEKEYYLNHVEFKKFTENTIMDKAELETELIKIREQGFSEDREENEIGLVCFATPIIDIKGNAVAAISMSGPSVRMRQKRNKIIKALRESAKQISITIGYQGE